MTVPPPSKEDADVRCSRVLCDEVTPALLEQPGVVPGTGGGPEMVERTCPTCRSPIIDAFQKVGPKYCSEECKPRCAVEGCERPRRKRQWCASHYAQWKRTGEAPKPFAYKWAKRQPCIVCGVVDPGAIHRRFCSDACRVLYRFHKGNVPTTAECVSCGVAIDLTVRGAKGQRKKSCVKFCKRCRQDYNKYKMSAAELAQRDGTACGLCGETVDMALRRQDSNMCASVDHVLPRSLGGSHEPENLQLAHLLCNQRKSDRVAQP